MIVNNYFALIGIIVTLSYNTISNDSKTKQLLIESAKDVWSRHFHHIMFASLTQQRKEPTDFIPKGFVLAEKINGDLNKDGVEDCVLIIKGTDKNNIIKDEYRGELDRNRRGIIVLFKNNGNYELAVKNYDCFSSENEDGGVYFAPELSVEISKGKLYFHYGHGRYGYWKYTFRFQNSDFELIGYDASENFGPVVNSEVSINYSIKKKITRVNTNPNAESGEEVFKETVTRINIDKLIKLSEIKDFDELDTSSQ